MTPPLRAVWRLVNFVDVAATEALLKEYEHSNREEILSNEAKRVSLLLIVDSKLRPFANALCPSQASRRTEQRELLEVQERDRAAKRRKWEEQDRRIQLGLPLEDEDEGVSVAARTGAAGGGAVSEALALAQPRPVLSAASVEKEWWRSLATGDQLRASSPRRAAAGGYSVEQARAKARMSALRSF